MGFLMMVVTAIGGILGAIALGLLKDEATAWLPSLNSRILAMAVRMVPAEQRERYAEEWASHVSEYPGKLSQLVQSVRFLRAGSEMQQISSKHIARMMNIFILLAAVGMISGMLVERYRELNFWAHHFLGFIDFAANIQITFMMVWFIWRKPQILKHLRGEPSDRTEP